MERRILIAVGLVVLLALCAQANLIYIAIEGTIDGVSDPYGHLEGKISSGIPISGYYCYESTTEDSDSSPDGGEYWNHTPPSGIYLVSNEIEFKTNTNYVEFAIGIVNDYYDRYQVNSFDNLPLPNETSVNEIIWGIEDSTGTALSSDALPATAPDLSEGVWDDNRLYIEGGPVHNIFYFTAEITSATVVPEPVTIVLMSLGALILRKRKL